MAFKPNQQIALTFLSEEDSIQIIITKSGWMGYYHVVIEDGETSKSNYTLMTAEQIKEKFQVEIDLKDFTKQ